MKFHWRDIVYVHSAFSHNTHRPARSHRYKNYTVTTDDFARAPNLRLVAIVAQQH